MESEQPAVRLKRTWCFAAVEAAPLLPMLQHVCCGPAPVPTSSCARCKAMKRCAWLLQGATTVIWRTRPTTLSCARASCTQVGVFAMGEEGLTAVENPSELFLSERASGAGASSAVTVTLEGTRPLLLEVQALCSPTHQVRWPIPVPTFETFRELDSLALHDRNQPAPAAAGGADAVLPHAPGACPAGSLTVTALQQI